MQAALEELPGVENAYVAAGESGFDIRIITAESVRLEDLAIDGIGAIDPVDFPPADEGAKLSHYRLAFDPDPEADPDPDGIYSLAFDDDRTDDLTAEQIDAALEGLDGIGVDGVEVIGGDGDFLISVTATEGFDLQHDGIGDLQLLTDPMAMI